MWLLGKAYSTNVKFSSLTHLNQSRLQECICCSQYLSSTFVGLMLCSMPTADVKPTP